MPTEPCIDGVRLDLFQVGQTYDVGYVLASLLVAEGWAEPMDDAPAAALARPPTDQSAQNAPRNLKRERFPNYLDGFPSVDAVSSRAQPEPDFKPRGGHARGRIRVDPPFDSNE